MSRPVVTQAGIEGMFVFEVQSVVGPKYKSLFCALTKRQSEIVLLKNGVSAAIFSGER